MRRRRGREGRTEGARAARPAHGLTASLPHFLVAAFISLTNSATARAAPSTSGSAASIRRTTAEPEIAPAAPASIAARTSSGVATPNPRSAGGAPVSQSTARRRSAGRSACLSAPVTPGRKSRYVYPLASPATARAAASSALGGRMAVRPIPARRAASSQRVAQGPEEIEERGGFEALSHRRRKAHRRVVVPREAEGEVRGLQGLKTFLGREIHRHAQGFEHVRRARRRRDAAVPVLHDGKARARGRERHGGRNVEGPCVVAARPHDVVRRAVRRERERRTAHRARGPGDLRGRRAPHDEGGQERGELLRRKRPREEFIEERFHFGGRERRAAVEGLKTVVHDAVPSVLCDARRRVRRGCGAQ